MSELCLPLRDDLIDHEAAWLDYAIWRDRARELNWRWPHGDDPRGPESLLDPEPWGDPPNPLRKAP